MKRQKIYISIAFTFCFLLFIGIMDYPFVARIYNTWVQGQVVSGYEKTVTDLQKTEQEQKRKRAEEYNQRLASGETAALSDAFLMSGPQSGEYEELLASDEEGVMAVIRIPKIKVELPIYHGTSEKTLQNGAGHLYGTSLPVGGSSTHTCISAHRGLPEKKMFTRLDELTEGDTFYIQVWDETLAYEVYKVETVTPDQTEPLLIRQGEDLATLITCTPYGINTHRLYVHGVRVPYTEREEIKQQRAAEEKEKDEYWWAVLTAALLIWMCILLYRFNRADSQRNKGEEKSG